MITNKAYNYAKVLFLLGINEDTIKETKQLFHENHELIEALDNPVVKPSEKEAVIDLIFTKEIRSFLKVLCTNRSINLAEIIFEGYEALLLESKNIVKAKLSYVSRPDETDIQQIKDMIRNKYKKAGVILELNEDASLIGGYVLSVGNTEYDKSIKGTLLELQKTLARR